MSCDSCEMLEDKLAALELVLSDYKKEIAILQETRIQQYYELMRLRAALSVIRQYVSDRVEKALEG